MYTKAGLQAPAVFSSIHSILRMLILGLLFSSPIAVSAQFAAGNLVVLQVGDGTSALTNAGTAIFMKEFTPAGAMGTTVTIPSSGASQMVLSGTATSEGMLSRSADGQLLVFGGYAAPAGTAGIASTTASAVNRAIGTVNPAGTFTRVATSATFFSGNNIRSAGSDGANNYWAHGANDGTNYFGTASTAATVQNAKINTRFTLVYNGNLYMSSGSATGTPATTGIFQVGTGLPVTSGQTLTTVINTTVGTSPSPFQFIFNAAGTICYLADDRTIANGGGIQKWTFSGGIWSLAYTLATGSGSTVGARGVTADFSGANPIVYATTTETSANRLIKITDTGASSGATATILVTAAANTVFRGLAFAPQVFCPTFASAPSNVSITNSTCASACTVSGGVITAPSGTPCPAGSTLQYQVDGGSWTTTLPTYAQTGPAQTIKTRCSCDADNTMNSAESTPVTTVPGVCTLPAANISVTETSGTANNDGTICAGASATLTASGGGTYLWSTTEATAQITVTPGSTTTYTVTVTSSNGCTTSTSTIITVNPLPTPGITVTETSGTTNNDGIICFGASATLTATGGTSYAWSNGVNTAGNTVSPASTTTYTVTVTNANGCTATASSTITVNPLPTPGTTVAETSGTSNNDGIICVGASASITATGGTSYAWSTGDNTATISVTPGATTTYTVTVTNANNCTATVARTIIVNALPIPSIAYAPNDTVCVGVLTTLTASGGITYSWSTGANTAATTVTPMSQGNS
ncbi:MAG: hypothetical protein KGS48_13870, partial [Bacteroidetes bacterium]|nr:hypothetical protein [Bacteroidota bacterium]